MKPTQGIPFKPAGQRAGSFWPVGLALVIALLTTLYSRTTQAQTPNPTQVANLTVTPTGSPNAPSASPTRTPRGFVLMPVSTVTPQVDGSIVHVVQPGEVLSNIAEAYQVLLSQIYSLNYLTDQSVIYPGQRLKIKTPDPTATPTETSTPTRVPTATRRPTRTPTQTLLAAPTSPAASQTPAAMQAPTAGIDWLLVAIGGLLVAGLSLVIAGSLLKKK
jgi:LysM repeat protein